MINKPFVINGRFSVQPQLGLIKQTGPIKETRIEPRLMNLLCILASKQGELVSRDLLTKEVWNDYGNADEGLTQAISYLRKVFNDDAKTIIETIPKKGYVLHADLTLDMAKQNNAVPNNKRIYIAIAAAVLVTIIGIYFMFFSSRHNGNDEIQGNRSTNAPANSTDVIRQKPQKGNSDKLPDSNNKSVQSPDVKKTD